MTETPTPNITTHEIPDTTEPHPETFVQRMQRLQDADLTARFECAHLHILELFDVVEQEI